MSNMQRRKGRRYELAAIDWFESHGHTVSDLNRSGFDGTDLWLPGCGLFVECKDHAKLDLAGWCKQAAEQSDNRPWVVLHKRRGVADVGQHYVTTRLDVLLDLLDEP